MDSTHLLRHIALCHIACGIEAAFQGYVVWIDGWDLSLYVNYGPHPIALVVVCLAQTVAQVYCLRRLKQSAESREIQEDDEEGLFLENPGQALGPHEERESHSLVQSSSKGKDDTGREFLPILLMGCVCNVGWSLSWIFGNHVLCRLFLTLGGISQLRAIFATSNTRMSIRIVSPRQNLLKQLIAKMRLGYVMLLLWKTWGVTDTFAFPGLAQQLNNLSFFLMLTISCGPDPTMSLVLITVLLALALGPSQEWNQMFLKIAAATAIVAALDWVIAKRLGSRKIMNRAWSKRSFHWPSRKMIDP